VIFSRRGIGRLSVTSPRRDLSHLRSDSPGRLDIHLRSEPHDEVSVTFRSDPHDDLTFTSGQILTTRCWASVMFVTRCQSALLISGTRSQLTLSHLLYLISTFFPQTLYIISVAFVLFYFGTAPDDNLSISLTRRDEVIPQRYVAHTLKVLFSKPILHALRKVRNLYRPEQNLAHECFWEVSVDFHCRCIRMQSE